MKVLVTGISGFIGTEVTKQLLKKNYEVIGLDVWDHADFEYGKQIKYVWGSVVSDSFLMYAMKGVDYIIHLAGILGTNESMFDHTPHEVYMTNIIGTSKVLHYAHEYGVKKVVFASTPDVPWLNPYKISKETCEKTVQVYREYFDLPVAVLKLYNVYGEGERCYNLKFDAPFAYGKAVPTFITQALKDEPLQVYGSGEQASDYIYVSDVARCFVKALETPAEKEPFIQIGTGWQTNVNSLAKFIKHVCQSKSEIVHVPLRKGETETQIVADTNKMYSVLGEKAQVPLEEGIPLTAQWINHVLHCDGN